MATPSARIVVGFAVIVEVTALAGPAMNARVCVAGLDNAGPPTPNVAVIVYEPATVEVNVSVHVPVPPVVHDGADAVRFGTAGTANTVPGVVIVFPPASFAVNVTVYAAAPSATRGPAGATVHVEPAGLGGPVVTVSVAGEPPTSVPPTVAWIGYDPATVDVSDTLHVPKPGPATALVVHDPAEAETPATGGNVTTTPETGLEFASFAVTVAVDALTPSSKIVDGANTNVETPATGGPATNTNVCDTGFVNAGPPTPNVALIVYDAATFDVNVIVHVPAPPVAHDGADAVRFGTAGTANTVPGVVTVFPFASFAVNVTVYAATPSAVTGPTGATVHVDVPRVRSTRRDRQRRGRPAHIRPSNCRVDGIRARNS